MRHNPASLDRRPARAPDRMAHAATVSVEQRRLAARSRIVMAAFVLCFAVIAVRVGVVSIWPSEVPVSRKADNRKMTFPRPDIIDRNGVVLASDVKIASVYADPRKIIDIDEAIELLTANLPGLGAEDLRAKFTSKRAFVWIKREVTPRQQSTIHNLGIPGIGFRDETLRVYPNGRAAAHVLGHVDVDSRGLAGIEKFLDGQGRLYVASLAQTEAVSSAPVQLSLDLRVQHAVFDELDKAMKRFQAIGAGGVVLDVHTGEVVAMVSLPDYNPNVPETSLDRTRINRLTAGVYELGSTFKAITFAMALDAGVTTLKSTYDARAPIKVGSFRIDDFHAKRRVLTMPEVFIYSSNIGTAKMALDVGLDGHKAFLAKLGFLRRLRTELPENAAPLAPRNFTRISSMTIGFGHGLSVSPFHLAAAGVALVNGGNLITPTFLVRDAAVAATQAVRVIKPETSRIIRELMMLNVSDGTATKAGVEGYAVGGKTGSAEKVVNGRYAKNALLTSFLGMFPGNDPRYVVLIMLDEPKAAEGTHGYKTSGWNAVPTAGRIIERIAPILGISPQIQTLTEKGRHALNQP